MSEPWWSTLRTGAARGLGALQQRGLRPRPSELAESLAAVGTVLLSDDRTAVLREATEPLRFALLGEPAACRRLAALVRGLFLAEAPVELLVPSAELSPFAHGEVDLVLVVADGLSSVDLWRHARARVERGQPTLVVDTGDGGLRDGSWGQHGAGTAVVRLAGCPEADAALLSDALLAVLPERHLALGRWLPSCRDRVAIRLIREAAWSTGRVAAVASLPTVVPGIGGVVASVADFRAILREQGALLLKLAALYGREPTPQQVLLELLPLAAGVLAGRTVLRGLAGTLPLPLGLPCRVALAYAGTWSLGHLARTVYQTAQPSRRSNGHG